MAASIAARVPRSFAWALVAGAARSYGIARVQLAGAQLAAPSLPRFEAGG
jgi:hypothetical protein